LMKKLLKYGYNKWGLKMKTYLKIIRNLILGGA
jgi:hypothetical protein